MKTLLFSFGIIFMAFSSVKAQNSLSGYWDGFISISGTNLKIIVHIEDNAKGFSGTLDIPQQGAKGLNLYSISQKVDSVFFRFSAGPNEGIFNGTFESDAKISGTYYQGPASFSFSMERSESKEKENIKNETDLIVSYDGIDIGGTLTMPEGELNAPLVIMSSGSGAQNRDSEIYDFKIFQIIAQHLAKHGIPSFRYDDRGIGKSTGNSADATIQILASDVHAIIEYFKGNHDYSFENFALLGHSQGGVVAGKVAAENVSVSHLILMGSTTPTLSEILRYQVEFAYQASPVSNNLVQKEIDARESLMRAYVDNQNILEAKEQYKKAYLNVLNSLPEAQKNAIPNLMQVVDQQTEQLSALFSSPQLNSLLFYEPTKDLEKLSIPVLALMGEKDTQVTIKQNEPKMRDALEKSGSKFTILTIDGANHLFQKANSGLASEYPLLEKSFVDGFLIAISSWLLTN